MYTPTSSHASGPRRTPRHSLIVVMTDDRSVCLDQLARHLPSNEREVSVIVACAGEPADLSTLKERISHAEYLLAPAGTPAEELRALGMRHACGDIVTLFDGSVPSRVLRDQERARA